MGEAPYTSELFLSEPLVVTCLVERSLEHYQPNNMHVKRYSDLYSDWLMVLYILGSPVCWLCISLWIYCLDHI